MSTALNKARVLYKNYRTIAFARMIPREIGRFVAPGNFALQLRLAARVQSETRNKTIQNILLRALVNDLHVVDQCRGFLTASINNQEELHASE
ncbi:MAG: hypothetical protein HOJ11_05785 [Gammaproteobacteria bacterium]|nr:hypothetical protein [Gammaproteobacteria bacterium]